MYIVQAKYEGIAPILFNSPDAMDLDEPTKRMSNEQRRAAAMARVYRNDDGRLILPPWNVKRCIIEGLQFVGTKVKGKSLAQYARALLFVDGPAIFAQDDLFIHEHPGRQPPGPRGKACIVRRPALDTGWELACTLRIVGDILDDSSLHVGIEAAGLYVGQGGWRPEYGRFIVKSWEVESE